MELGASMPPGQPSTTGSQEKSAHTGSLSPGDAEVCLCELSGQGGAQPDCASAATRVKCHWLSPLLPQFPHSSLGLLGIASRMNYPHPCAGPSSAFGDHGETRVSVWWGTRYEHWGVWGHFHHSTPTPAFRAPSHPGATNILSD